MGYSEQTKAAARAAQRRGDPLTIRQRRALQIAVPVEEYHYTYPADLNSSAIINRDYQGMKVSMPAKSAGASVHQHQHAKQMIRPPPTYTPHKDYDDGEYPDLVEPSDETVSVSSGDSNSDCVSINVTTASDISTAASDMSTSTSSSLSPFSSAYSCFSARSYPRRSPRNIKHPISPSSSSTGPLIVQCPTCTFLNQVTVSSSDDPVCEVCNAVLPVLIDSTGPSSSTREKTKSVSTSTSNSSSTSPSKSTSRTPSLSIPRRSRVAESAPVTLRTTTSKPVSTSTRVKQLFITRHLSDHYFNVVAGRGSPGARFYVRAPKPMEPLYNLDVLHCYCIGGKHVKSHDPDFVHPLPESASVLLPLLGVVTFIRFYPYTFQLQHHVDPNTKSRWSFLNEARMGMIVHVHERPWPMSGKPCYLLVDVQNIIEFIPYNDDWRKYVHRFVIYHALRLSDSDSRLLPHLICQLPGCDKYACHFAADEPSLGMCTDDLRSVSSRADQVSNSLPLQYPVSQLNDLYNIHKQAQMQNIKHPSTSTSMFVPSAVPSSMSTSMSTLSSSWSSSPSSASSSPSPYDMFLRENPNPLPFPPRRIQRRLCFQYIDGFRCGDQNVARDNLLHHVAVWDPEGNGNAIYHYPIPTTIPSSCARAYHGASVLDYVMDLVSSSIGILQYNDGKSGDPSFWSSPNFMHVISLVIHSNGSDKQQLLHLGARDSSRSVVFDLSKLNISLLAPLSTLPLNINCPVLFFALSCSLELSTFDSLQQHIRIEMGERGSTLPDHLYVLYLAGNAGLQEMCTLGAGIIRQMMEDAATTVEQAFFAIAVHPMYKSLCPRMLIPSGQVLNPWFMQSPMKDQIRPVERQIQTLAELNSPSPVATVTTTTAPSHIHPPPHPQSSPHPNVQQTCSTCLSHCTSGAPPSSIFSVSSVPTSHTMSLSVTFTPTPSAPVPTTPVSSATSSSPACPENAGAPPHVISSTAVSVPSRPDTTTSASVHPSVCSPAPSATSRPGARDRVRVGVQTHVSPSTLARDIDKDVLPKIWKVLTNGARPSEPHMVERVRLKKVKIIDPRVTKDICGPNVLRLLHLFLVFLYLPLPRSLPLSLPLYLCLVHLLS